MRCRCRSARFGDDVDTTGRLTSAHRDRALDLIRAAAVLLVMGTHLREAPPEAYGALLRGTIEALRRGGWVGVDVFFCLSGFLVAGLLFREQAQSQRISGMRFLIRRGFKIYPAYYALLAATWILIATGKYPIDPHRLVNSALFIGNYVVGAWPHLWSLAVEEHFYILLVASLVPWARRDAGLRRPFAALPWVVAVLGLLSLWGRAHQFDTLPGGWIATRERTHLRIDALAFGACLAWLRQYHRAVWLRVLSKGKWLLPSGVVLLTPPFIMSFEHHWFYPFGFTVYSLASALILVGALSIHVPSAWFIRWLAVLGRRSYSVYLVHFPVEALSGRVFSATTEWIEYAVFYGVASIALGVLLAVIVEEPFLRLRDRLYPAGGH